MPTWWGELITLLHTFGFWFVLTALAFGIIIQYLIRPYFGQISHAFHRIFIHTKKLHDAQINPAALPDEEGYPILYTRHDVYTRQREIIDKLDKIRVDVETKFCVDSCPMHRRIAEHMTQQEKREVEFFDKVLEMRKATQKEIDASYARINEFMNEVLAKREDSLDKRDEMLSKAFAVLERMTMDKKSGG